MDRAEQLRDDLTFTDRMIAESQLNITRLKTIIAEMSRDAQDTNLAREVLASYAAALTRHEAQRRLIVSMMDKEHPGQPDEAKAPSAKSRSPGQPRTQGGRRARSPRRAARR